MSPRGTRYIVSHTARIATPASRVYAILVDYRDGHPRILPAPFQNLVVESGGVGAGTRTRFDVRAFGRTQSFRHEILEPEPGRVLVERDLDSDSRTTFIVEAEGENATVTIRSELVSRSGVAGAIERFLSKRFLLRMYREELGSSNHWPETESLTTTITTRNITWTSNAQVHARRVLDRLTGLPGPCESIR